MDGVHRKIWARISIRNSGNRRPPFLPIKEILYFTSNRPGGYGGNDIYVCHRLENGRWSVPGNLGPNINTAGDESAPFIHADNSSLYFTSNALPGYGGDDLFVVRKTATGEWGIPENLGYPINTIENEGSLVVAADGKTAYYASDRADSRGQLDLYSFELRKDVRPARTVWVKGKVFDKKTGKGLPSSVELGDLVSKRIISKLQTDETGNYLTTLPIGSDYAFNVNRKGYLFFSENFMLSHPTADSVYQMDIPLQPIEANASIILKNIFFDVNQYELKPASQIELDEVVKLLKENPLVAYTDQRIYRQCRKTGRQSAAFPENRAKSVVNYLKSKGIDPRRLSFKGYGEGQPVSPNNTEAGRASNRTDRIKSYPDWQIKFWKKFLITNGLSLVVFPCSVFTGVQISLAKIFMHPDLLYLISLTRVPQVGCIHAKTLLQHFGSAEAVFKSSIFTLEKIEGIGKIRARSIKTFRDFQQF